MRVRVADEVEKLAEALLRPMRVSRDAVTQSCPICECAITTGIRGPEIDDDSLRSAMFRAYDEHECERLASMLYGSNDGIDLLYARIEMQSVQMASRAQELAADLAADPSNVALVERAESESRYLAHRAKRFEWLLQHGAPARR